MKLAKFTEILPVVTLRILRLGGVRGSGSLPSQRPPPGGGGPKKRRIIRTWVRQPAAGEQFGGFLRQKRRFC